MALWLVINQSIISLAIRALSEQSDTNEMTKSAVQLTLARQPDDLFRVITEVVILLQGHRGGEDGGRQGP